MRQFILVLSVCLVSVSPAAAQWLTHLTPGLPRTADGKPDLAASVKRTVDGRPDHLSAQVTVAPHVLEQYAGSYAAGPLGKLKVIVHDGELALILPGGDARHRVIAKSDHEFLVATLGTPLAFLKNERGEVTHLRLTSVEGDIDAPRLPAR